MKKIKIILFFLTFGLPVMSYSQLSLNCENDSSGLIPLTDLGTGFYEGIQGGLYPDGSNDRPLLHLQKGLEISETIEPLNELGNVNYGGGEILFVGMGGSTASNAFNMFIDTMKHYDWVGTNPCMTVKGLFYGGKDLHDMIDTTSTFYWDEIQGRLFNRGDTWEQIQVVWILEQSELATDDMEYYIDYVADQYTALMHVLLDSMPNLKMVYLSGFHYTGYTHPNHELYEYLVEPYGYWGNLAIKEVIARQINGDPELAFEGELKKAPYINWGPYFWADGANPRGNDFLTWPCEEYRDDDTGGGFHLEENGKYKEAKMLINFYYADTVAERWYMNSEIWADCLPGGTGSLRDAEIKYQDPVEQALNIYPANSPNKIIFEISGAENNNLPCALYNAEGEKILQQTVNTAWANKYQLNVEELPEGMYVFFVQSDQGTISEKFYLKNYRILAQP